MMIRPMRAEDVDAVADLTTQLGYPASAGDIASRFDRIAGAPNHAVLVADDAGKAIAWLHVAMSFSLEIDPAAEILGFVVADGHRSRGTGTALLNAAEAWAAGQGCRTLRVRSQIIRERAHLFYERSGFERIKTQHCFQKRLDQATRPQR